MLIYIMYYKTTSVINWHLIPIFKKTEYIYKKFQIALNFRKMAH